MPIIAARAAAEPPGTPPPALLRDGSRALSHANPILSPDGCPEGLPDGPSWPYPSAGVTSGGGASGADDAVGGKCNRASSWLGLPKSAPGGAAALLLLRAGHCRWPSHRPPGDSPPAGAAAEGEAAVEASDNCAVPLATSTGWASNAAAAAAAVAPLEPWPAEFAGHDKRARGPLMDAAAAADDDDARPKEASRRYMSHTAASTARLYRAAHLARTLQVRCESV